MNSIEQQLDTLINHWRRANPKVEFRGLLRDPGFVADYEVFKELMEAEAISRDTGQARALQNGPPFTEVGLIRIQLDAAYRVEDMLKALPEGSPVKSAFRELTSMRLVDSEEEKPVVPRKKNENRSLDKTCIRLTSVMDVDAVLRVKVCVYRRELNRVDVAVKFATVEQAERIAAEAKGLVTCEHEEMGLFLAVSFIVLGRDDAGWHTVSGICEGYCGR